MRSTSGILLILFSTGVALAQSPDPATTFEVASIKQSPPRNGGMMRVGCNGGPGTKDPGRITCSNINVANLVLMGYGISHYQLAGLSISDDDRFEFAVKLPEGATKDQVKVMWQNLLKERFKVVLHRETKDTQVLELVVAKGGLKLKESTPPPPPDPDAPPPPPPPPSGGPAPKFNMDKDGFPELPAGRGVSMIMMNGKARWRASEATMAQVASMLASQLGQPVNDATGLAGKYDFTLSWATESFSNRGGGAAAGGSASPIAGLPDTEGGPTLQSAIQSQLGLKLEQKKGTIEMLVVDHAEKVPTEN
jgi:uncharacterized protein (TIGR03435 family)